MSKSAAAQQSDRRIASAMALSAVAQLGAKAVHLLLNIIASLALIRYLGPASYGDYVFVFSLSALFGLVSDFGLAKVALREMVRDPVAAPSLLGTAIAARLALAAVSAVLAQGALAAIGARDEVRLAVAVSSLVFVTDALFSIAVVFQARLAMQYEALVSVAAQAVDTALIFWMISTGAGLLQFVAVPVASGGIAVVLAAALVRGRFRTTLGFDAKRLPYLLKESLPVGVTLFLAVAYLIFNRVLSGGAVAEVKYSGAVLAALFVSYFGMHFLARFTERIGLDHTVPGLVATSFHSRTDAFASLLAGLGVVTAAMGFGIERYFAALIGLLLVADAAQLFVDATRRLVGLDEDSPTEQLPFWVRLREALRQYAKDMPPLIRWLLRYDDALSPEELRKSRRFGLAVVLLIYLCSGFKTVQLGELGGLKVLGRYSGLRQAGPVYALWPFASVRIVPVDRVQEVDVGFRFAATWASHQEDRPFGEMLWKEDERNELVKVVPEESRYMLGDTTQVETHLAVTYTVRHDKAQRYLFGVEDPAQLMHRASQHAVQQLMLRRELDGVLVEQRSDLEDEARVAVQEFLDRPDIDAGITVERVMIRSVHPPVPVLDSFVDVATAIENQHQYVVNAQGELTRATVTAEGDAARILNDAEGARITRIADARGQTAAYRAIAGAMAADPEAIKARMAIESQERILKGKKKIVLPRAAGRDRSKIWFNYAPTAPAAPAMVPGGPQEAPAPAPDEGGAGESGSQAQAAAPAPADQH